MPSHASFQRIAAEAIHLERDSVALGARSGPTSSIRRSCPRLSVPHVRQPRVCLYSPYPIALRTAARRSRTRLAPAPAAVAVPRWRRLSPFCAWRQSESVAASHHAQRLHKTAIGNASANPFWRASGLEKKTQGYALAGPMATASPSAEETMLPTIPANRPVEAMQELPRVP